MAFTLTPRVQKTFTTIGECRYAIHKMNGNNLVGCLTIPKTVVDELGWKPSQSLDLLVGSGADEGWYGLEAAPAGTKHRATLHVERNGVGRYNTNSLVMPGVTESAQQVALQINIRNQTLFINLGGINDTISSDSDGVQPEHDE